MGYASLRYQLTRAHNGLPQVCIVARAPLTETRPMLTYAELMDLVIAAMRRQHGVAENAPDPQTLLNRRYQLRLLMRAAAKDDEARIDDDFTDAFDQLSERAIAQVPSPRTQGDVRRGLRWWRSRYQDVMSRNHRGVDQQPAGSLATVLGQSLARRRVNHARAAGIVGVPSSTLSSWLQGVIPRTASAAGLRRLESALELAPGALTTLSRQPAPEPLPVPASSYRARIRELRKDHYRLATADVGAQLREEWESLLHYKTSRAPTLKRSRRAVWRLVSGTEGRRNTSWHNTLGTSYCATADVEWKHVAGLIGFALNKPAVHGFTLLADWEPTIAVFAVPELVEHFFRWLVERADGVANNRVKTLANFVQSLTENETGWLTQQPVLLERLPGSMQTRTWSDACAAVNALATAYRGESRGGISRDPFEPLRGLLSLAEPFAPIRDAIRALDARALGAGLQSATAAVAKRDALLLVVLMSIPLRLRNLVLLRYRADQTGTLRKEPDGRWWIRIPAHETKNKKAIAVRLPKSATARLDEYVAIYRPRLLMTSQCECVFPASMGHPGPWWGLNVRLFSLTKTYIPGCMGFHTHGFRDLVATRWLDKHPEDYPTVAHLLGDDLQTAIKTYSRPSPARAVDRANEDIDALMS